MRFQQPKRKVSTGYVPRELQAKIHNQLKRRNALVQHRRAGKTVLAVNEIIDQSIRFNRLDPKTRKPLRNPQFAYVATTVGQVEIIAWPYFKEYLKDIPGVVFNETKLRVRFPHPRGTVTIFCWGAEKIDAKRGVYLDGYILDEYGDMHPDVRDKVMLPTISDRKGWEIIMGTPKGENDFKTLYDKALLRPDQWFACLVKASETGILPPEELAALKDSMSDEAYAQEYECDFNAAPCGKYYQKYMDDAVKQGRVGKVPWDSSHLVTVYMDLGRDGMAFWFVQEVNREPHVIRYWEEHGRGMECIVEKLNEFENLYGYQYNEIVLPHDGGHKDGLITETTRAQYLENHGFDVRVLERTLSVAEDIHAVRVLLRKCHFDHDNCNPYIKDKLLGIASLRAYEKKFDAKQKVFLEKPTHNWASHAADAFRMFAVDYEPGFGTPLRQRHFNLPAEADTEYDMLG